MKKKAVFFFQLFLLTVLSYWISERKSKPTDWIKVFIVIDKLYLSYNAVRQKSEPGGVSAVKVAESFMVLSASPLITITSFTLYRSAPADFLQTIPLYFLFFALRNILRICFYSFDWTPYTEII